MRQLFKIILVIISLALIPATIDGFFKFSREKARQQHPSPSPSAIPYLGWKEYKNETFRYKLKYPYDWFVLPSETSEPENWVLTNIPLENYPDKPHVNFYVRAQTFSGSDLAEYSGVKKLVKDGREGRPLTIAKTKALLFSQLGEFGELAEVFVLGNEAVIDMTWTQTQIGLISPNEDKILQIVASVEFF